MFSGTKGYRTKPPAGVMLNPLHPLSQGLVGYWLFNEGAGSVAHDISGKGNHGTLNNLPQRWVGSPFGGSVDIRGSNEWIDYGNSKSFDTTDLSAIIWINFKSRADYNVMISKRSKSANTPMQWTLGLDEAAMAGNDEIFWGYHNVNWRYIRTSGANLENNRWYQIIGTRRGNVLKAYLDGRLLGTHTDAGSANPLIGTETVRIGDTTLGNAELNADVGMATVYNRALSPTEAKQLYEDPFCNLLRVPVRYAPAAPGGLSIPVAMNYYRRRRVA